MALCFDFFACPAKIKAQAYDLNNSTSLTGDYFSLKLQKDRFKDSLKTVFNSTFTN